MKYIKVKFDIADGDGVRMEEGLLLQTAKDILCQLAGNIGFDSFEDEGATVTGYVQKQLFDRPELDSILAGFPIMNLNITYEAQDAEDKNWNEAWEENGFEPITVNGKCVIHDTTHTPPHRGNGMEITIDTKQAFGTGGHETTYMIVSELLDSDVKGKRVLDCGCGTGILSILSAKLGAKDVTGYDIDEWSVSNTRHNCGLNGVGNVTVLHGDASVISTLATKFDMILANINRNILLNDMSAFKSAMSDGATLILSGFYEQDADMLINSAERLGLKTVKRETRHQWCMLVFENADA